LSRILSIRLCRLAAQAFWYLLTADFTWRTNFSWPAGSVS
jgi:hypothetical protein